MKEVISIPASDTIDIIKKHLVHAHPHPRTYKEAQFVAFRKAGGYMDTLYRINKVLILNPLDKYDIDLKIKYLDNESKQRLLNYITERRNSYGFGVTELYKFYTLQVEESLLHNPKPVKNKLQGHTYFTYKEITDGKAEIEIENATLK
ncbi:hypothetical protein [Bacillus sp. AFS096315]|uniref:hypothetical protein n=1 Tax=Bacillus sp. AFS096315 TaxID=2033517 RepID=UPI000BEB69D6|nr:hypothetical protein [Bacillus sp. AFS096315]PEC46372.1 hypothetical protein CON00_23920 [Bacillus sp. AFS096315]